MPTYRWSSERGLFEVGAQDDSAPSGGPMVIRDIEPGVSPIDGTVLSSRSQIREHCREHDVVQVGNDFRNARRRKQEH